MTLSSLQRSQLAAAFELVHLRVSAGFRFLEARTKQDPGDIRQFAIDYLAMPRTLSSKEEIIAYLVKKETELCTDEK